MSPDHISSIHQFIGNKAKGWISKWVFQENKAHQISWKKKKHFWPPDMHTYIGGRIKIGNLFFFSENLVCFVFLKHSFWDSPFCCITDKLTLLMLLVSKLVIILKFPKCFILTYGKVNDSQQKIFYEKVFKLYNRCFHNSFPIF